MPVVGTASWGDDPLEPSRRRIAAIAELPDVVGSVIVGEDGVILFSNLPRDFDFEVIAIWSIGIFVNTRKSIKKLGHDHLHQIVMKSAYGHLVLADVGCGLFITISDGHRTEQQLISLVRKITELTGL